LQWFACQRKPRSAREPPLRARDHSVNASRLHKKAPDDAGALIYGRETCAEINTSRQATEV